MTHPAPTPERPLVTFALVAYNQEKYIRKAVEGAFSQTYQPLEIALSDDCSSDQTYEIMREMAAAYKGPHKILVRKNVANIGTLAHIQSVVASTSGKLIVLAAGDDISRPNRVELLYDSWKSEGSWGIYSDYAEIDHRGLITKDHTRSDFISAPGYRLRSYMKGSRIEEGIVHGSTSAYDRSLFKSVTITEEDYILAEDGALSLLLHILGRSVSCVPLPLVEYRKHDDSITNGLRRRLSWKELVLAENKISQFALSQSNRCRFIIDSHKRLNSSCEPRIDEQLVLEDFNRQRFVATWWNHNLIQRLKILISMDAQFARWAFPRLLPKNIFLALKYTREKFRKK